MESGARQKMTKMATWLAIAAAMTILTIIGHELAHYLAAGATGAENLHLHWADISFDEASVSAPQLAAIWIAGPVLTNGIILGAWFSGARGAAILSLGLGAASRNIVILPFALKLLLGRDTTSFYNDEAAVAGALGVSPLPSALVTVVFGIGGTVLFARRAYRDAGWRYPLILIAGMVLGIALWGIIGPMLLGGGRGLN